MVYKIRCPKCGKRADGVMKQTGTKGTYREAYARYGLDKIVCFSCGYSKECGEGQEDEYELWYKTDLRGHSLWAYNEEYIDSLIDWLEKGKRTPGEVFETLPKWILGHRKEVVSKLQRLKSR